MEKKIVNFYLRKEKINLIMFFFHGIAHQEPLYS